MNQFLKLIVLLSVLVLYLFGFQTTILAEGDGYGENPGGAGGDTIIVDNKEDLKLYAGSSERYVILIKDTIDVGSEVRVRSYKTISGIDSKSTIKGDVNISSGAHDVVIKNLNITNPSNDGITVRNASYVLITNCTVYDCSDGCIDVTVESDFVTISNCRFYYENVTFHKFANLIGASDDDVSDRGKLHVTFHDNWWDRGCGSRMPRVRFGYVHLYNNYFSCTDNNYASRAGFDGNIYSEYNYFNGVRDPLTVEDGGKAKSEGNEYVNCTGTIFNGTDEVFTPSYSYLTKSALSAKQEVMQGAGNASSEPLLYSGKKQTEILWSDQVAMIYGTALSETQLNATAVGNTSAPVYSHPLGTIVPEGYQTITVSFPEDAEYEAASKTVNIKVNYEYFSLTKVTINGTDPELIQTEPEGSILNGKLVYPKGTEVTLTAKSDLLSKFSHWQNENANDTLTIVMTENNEVRAYYEPLNYIVAWDLYKPGNKDRFADFYMSKANQTSTLQLANVSGTSTTWVDYSETTKLMGKNAAMIRRGGSSAGNYFFQIRFNTTEFGNIQVLASMLGMNSYYQVQNVEYSTDGITFFKAGEINLEQSSNWYSDTFHLPEEVNGRDTVIVRFKADKGSILTTNGVIGTSIGEIIVLGDKFNSVRVHKNNADLKIVETHYYSVDGKRQSTAVDGINIIVVRYEDGSIKVEKLIVNKL